MNDQDLAKMSIQEINKATRDLMKKTIEITRDTVAKLDATKNRRTV